MPPKSGRAGITRALLDLIETLPLPVVLRIHGENHEFELALVAACDIVIASLESSFVATLSKTGEDAKAWADLVMHVFGKRPFARYVLTGEPFTAAEAYRIGVIHEIAPISEMDAKINEILGHLVLREPKLLSVVLRMSRESLFTDQKLPAQKKLTR